MTIVLGDEYDDALRSRVLAVLRELEAIPGPSTGKIVGGSQEYERFDLTLDGHPLRLEAETGIGLTIHGPKILVERIQRLVTHQPPTPA